MDPALVAELRALEERLLRLETRTSAADLAALLTDDFVEFGSSGRVFDKAAIIASLASETDALVHRIEDFRAVALAADVALVTYRLVVTAAPSLRSSLWRRTGDHWRLQFHQGTRIPV